jgi:hypothetical protein
MPVAQSPHPLLDEFADLIAAGATPAQVLAFHPPAETVARAGELLEKLKADELTPDEEHELTMFQQAELMLRLVKARVRRSGQA